MTTAVTVLSAIALLFAWAAGVVALRAFCRWSLARESARSFEDAFIPQAEDVARAQADRDACIALADIRAELDAALSEVRR